MKPDKLELKMALDEAERIRDEDLDNHFVAKSLLYLNHRNNDLEEVLEHLEKYLRFGMPVEEHSALVHLLDKIREREDEVDDSKGFGL